MTLPDGYKKIDRNGAKSHVLQKFKGDKMATEMAGGIITDYMYSIGDVLVVLKPQQGPVTDSIKAQKIAEHIKNHLKFSN